MNHCFRRGTFSHYLSSYFGRLASSRQGTGEVPNLQCLDKRRNTGHYLLDEMDQLVKLAVRSVGGEKRT